MKKSFFSFYTILFSLFLSLVSVAGWGQTTIFSENMGAGLTGTPAPADYTGFQNYGSLDFSGTGDLRNTNASSGYTGASGANNVMLNASGETLIIDGINASSFIDLSLSFGVRKGTNDENGTNLIVEYSTTGATGTFTPISKANLNTGASTAKWYLRTSTSAISSDITTLRFRSTNTVEWRIDDVKLTGTAGVAACSQLLISEYIEGTDNNKFIEIYNPTNAAINLAHYRLANYQNGTTAPTYTQVLSGTLAAYSTYVVANAGYALTLPCSPSLTTSATNSVMAFDGNDVIALQTSGGTNIDVIGTIGSNANFAQNISLTRRKNIKSPKTTYAASEWETTATADSVVGLCSHISDCQTTSCTAGNCGTDLFISEYVEGSGNNKYLEIYNPTSSAIDLSNYRVVKYTNGSPSVTGTPPSWSGSIAAGGTFIISHNQATIYAGTVNVSNIYYDWNGNDAVALQKNNANIDVIGQIGVDPGTQWGSGNTSTLNRTLRRKSSISTGDPNGIDEFDPAIQWDGYPQNNIADLGSHSIDPCAVDGGSGENYRWTGAARTHKWDDPCNWVLTSTGEPGGIPAFDDNVILDQNNSFELFIDGAKTVNNFALNGSGRLTIGSSGTLTIKGEVTYSDTATALLDCSSTINFAGSISQTVPPLYYGNLNILGGPRVLSSNGKIRICNNFTANAASYTYDVTGSTVEHTAATAKSLSPFTYNNLEISGMGPFLIGHTQSGNTVNVLGDYSQTAGSVYLTSGNNSYSATLNINGKMKISGGTFNMKNDNSNTALPVVNLRGDLEISGNGLVTTTSTNTTGLSNFNFDGSEVQNISNSNSTLPIMRVNFNVKNGAYVQLVNQDFKIGGVSGTTASKFTVESGGTLDFGFNDNVPLNLTGFYESNGIFDLQNGGKLKISSPQGITSGGNYTGNVQLGATAANRNFAGNAIYHYIGKVSQETGTGLPKDASNKRVIVELEDNNLEFSSNNGIIRFDNPSTAVGSNFKGLEIRKGTVVADNVGNRFEDGATSGVGNLKMTGGIYKIYTSDIQPAVSGSYDLAAGSKIIFAHTTTGTTTQAIRGGTSYQYPNIEIEGKAVRYSNIGINMKSGGLFTVKENAVVTNTGNVGQITSLDDANPATLTIKNNATFRTEKELGFSGVPNGIIAAPSVSANRPSGNVNIVLEDGSTVEYSRSDIQTITTQLFGTAPHQFNYQNLKISGTGTKKPNTKNLLVNNVTTVASATLEIPETADNEEAYVLTSKLGIQSTGGSVVFGSGAQLMQEATGVTNSANIQFQRKTKMQQMDYTYWSAPVSGQSLTAFSPGTPSNRIYEYVEATDLFRATPDTQFLAAKGYAIRGQSGFDGSSKTFTFNGTPQNGNALQIQIQKSKNSVISGTTYEHGYNLIGNPYPSNIDFIKFLDTDLGGGDKNANYIDGKAWFWTNSAPHFNMEGSSYSGNNYAVISRVGGTPPTYTPGTGIYKPTNIIKLGQGFIVQKSGAAPTGDEPNTAVLKFNNAMRDTSIGVFYNNVGKTAINRYWLKLISPSQIVNTILLAHMDGATENYDPDYDAELFAVGDDSFYSALGNQKLQIQAVGTFDENQVFPLTTKHFENGTYKIEVEDPEGIFASEQKIYLHDKQDNTYHDLSQAFTFEAQPGQNQGRFEVVYVDKGILGTGVAAAANFALYRDGQEAVIKSSKILGKVEIYDASGRLVKGFRLSSKEAHINMADLAEGFYIFKVENSGDLKTKKWIR